MKKIYSDTKTPSSRSFAKSALTALAVAPLASLSARGNDDVQDRERERQSSPITIGGGGSVGIDFNSHHFSETKKSEFSHAQDTLHKLWLVDKYGALENITPANEDCVVRVQCKNGSKERTITIKGKPLGIEFDTVEFPKKKPNDGKKEIYHNKKYKIVKIDVEVAGQTIPYEAPTKGKCTIVVVNSL